MKVRACNGGDDNDCSSWSTEAKATVPGTPPPVGPPGPVGPVSFANLTATSFKVTWEAPERPGNQPISGYGIQRKLGSQETPWPPTDQVVAVGRTPREWTFQGLQAGTHWVRIQACNGKNRCADWPTDGYSVTIPPTTSQVQLTTLTADTSSFTVTWNAPDTGGVAITGYHVLWRRDDAAWVENDARRLGATARSHTATGLNTNTTYVVKVRACRGANGNAPCLDWSADGQVKIPDVDRIMPAPPALSNPVSPECPLTPDTEIASSVPQNLDVTPQSQRRATVCWSPARGAARYVIQATENVANILATPDAEWYSIGNISATVISDKTPEPQSYFLLELDAIVTSGGSKRGLANRSAFGIRIGATFTGAGTFYSAPIIIIDTPITEANGDSRGTRGRAHITWDPVRNILNDNYANGPYELRYRQSSGDHTTTTWTPEQFEPPPNTNFRVSGNPHTIRNLAHGRSYAVQLVYRDDSGNNHDTDVFSARNVYVWPSVGPPNDGDRVATFPLTARLQNNRFQYRICDDSFGPPGDPRRAKWEALINRAFEQSSNASKNLVTFARVVQPCATDEESGIDYDDISSEIKTTLERGAD